MSSFKASSPSPVPARTRLSKNPPSTTSTPIADQFKALNVSTQSSSLYPVRAAPSPPLGRSTSPTSPGSARQRHSYLLNRPATASQIPNIKGMSNYGTTASVPPPRPSRANTSNLNDIISSESPQYTHNHSSRRLSTPSMSTTLNGGGSTFANSTSQLVLDNGDSASQINGGGSTIGSARSRSGTVKNKKGMLSFMSGE